MVVFEVLERERSKKVSGLAQLLFFVLGFCALMLIELLGKIKELNIKKKCHLSKQVSAVK